MQHGSYHVGDIENQPQIEAGEAVLYRGVQKAETYVLHRLTTSETRRRVMDVHAQPDRFNRLIQRAHCNLMLRYGLLEGSELLFDGLCREAGLDPDAPSLS